MQTLYVPVQGNARAKKWEWVGREVGGGGKAKQQHQQQWDGKHTVRMSLTVYKTIQDHRIQSDIVLCGMEQPIFQHNILCVSMIQQFQWWTIALRVGSIWNGMYGRASKVGYRCTYRTGESKVNQKSSSCSGSGGFYPCIAAMNCTECHIHECMHILK